MATKKGQKTEAKKKPASKASTPVKAEAKSNRSDLPTAAVVRIAKANGAERVGADGAASIVQMAEAYIGKLAKEANKLASHAGRKTLKAEDIEMASENL
ncbi:MAG: NFYB/HAP3 family transcription factor subunit [Methanospirillum sp.]|uniref:histone family protein n=1 Tax=Methanospirillum sp. TaxID=45200 RepID=UPI00236A3983|nr:histone [Methanospirillum sp.]MDD1727770.1 NFYB/HAP3 family transcription factor subunit [Methanospirillum sp.]